MVKGPGDEETKARDMARRYGCEFVDLLDCQLHHELFKKIPNDLMFKYNFVPLEEVPEGRMAIAIADPTQLMMIDEISLLLDKRIITRIATLSQIVDILKKTERRLSTDQGKSKSTGDGTFSLGQG